jgi:hypothetical protein
MLGFRKAFVFSLDAFIALSLILITIHALLMLVSMPKGYYTSFEQAYDLAKDTLAVLEHANYSESQSYLDYISSRYIHGGSMDGNVVDVMRVHVDPLIPEQFGYRFDYKNITSGQWEMIYDTKNDINHPSEHKHNNETRKLGATAQSLAVGYSVSPDIGQSPYRYICCGGGNTVCNVTTSNYNAGDVYMGLIRITVYI